MFNGTVSAFQKCICDRLEPSGFLNHGTSWSVKFGDRVVRLYRGRIDADRALCSGYSG